MIDELNNQLFEIKSELLLKRKLEKDLSNTEIQIGSEEKRKERLLKILNKEQADVKKLEGLSLTALFQDLLGNKEKQLEVERQEYLRANLNHTECIESLKVLQNESLRLKNEISKLKNLENEYQSLLNKKEFALLNKNDEKTSKLLDLSEQLINKNARLREIEEADKAGKIVLDEVKKTLDSLDKAENWGIWDMFGGGIISTSMKHSHIDYSRTSAHRVQQALRHFERELKDIEIKENISIEIGSFLTFADYFFDGLITDWLVQDEIKTSISRTLKLQNQINEILKNLNKLHSFEKQEYDRIFQTRLDLIENAL